ncbi:MAG TPA: cobalamin-dependent protein [Victivallales bacterium]|nr:cobalamin-dependent protein [Victivallales bacterium]
MNELITKFKETLLEVDKIGSYAVYDSIRDTYSPTKFIDDIVVPALKEIGDNWTLGSVALSQVFMSGVICEELIKNILPDENIKCKNHPIMAICVMNDYHLLGKRVVYSMLRASGFNLLDLGTVNEEELIETVLKKNIKILLISTLMLHSALKIKNVTDKFKKIGTDIKVIVGGAPFNFDKNLWKDVGAYATGKTASDAAHIIMEIIK